MIIELIILLSAITSIVLSLLKLFTSIFDNFYDDAGLWTDCGQLTLDECQNPLIHRGNCRVFTLGPNRHRSQVCRQSAIATGAFGNPRIVRS